MDLYDNNHDGQIYNAIDFINFVIDNAKEKMSLFYVVNEFKDLSTIEKFKKSVDEEMAEKVLKYLYKKTDLQCNISFNMVALSNGKPETMGLKTIIHHYVNHQKDIITRRTRRELHHLT